MAAVGLHGVGQQEYQTQQGFQFALGPINTNITDLPPSHCLFEESAKTASKAQGFVRTKALGSLPPRDYSQSSLPQVASVPQVETAPLSNIPRTCTARTSSVNVVAQRCLLNSQSYTMLFARSKENPNLFAKLLKKTPSFLHATNIVILSLLLHSDKASFTDNFVSSVLEQLEPSIKDKELVNFIQLCLVNNISEKEITEKLDELTLPEGTPINLLTERLTKRLANNSPTDVTEVLELDIDLMEV